MTIPQSFIQELLARVDVVDIVGRYVQLKKGGAKHSPSTESWTDRLKSFFGA